MFSDSSASAFAVTTLGAPPSPQVVDIINVKCALAHGHEDLLRMTAKQLGVQLTRELPPCRGYSEAKGLRRPIPRWSLTRAASSASMAFVGLSDPKSVKSHGAKWYTMVVRYDYSRFTDLYFCGRRRRQNPSSRVTSLKFARGKSK